MKELRKVLLDLFLPCPRRRQIFTALQQAEQALHGEGMAWEKGSRLREDGTLVQRERSVGRVLRGHWLSVSLEMQMVK